MAVTTAFLVQIDGTTLAWLIPSVIAGLAAIGGGLFKAGGWFSNVNSDRKSFKEFMDEIRGDIKEILLRLPPLTVASSSPLRLTDFGEKNVCMDGSRVSGQSQWSHFSKQQPTQNHLN